MAKFITLNTQQQDSVEYYLNVDHIIRFANSDNQSLPGSMISLSTGKVVNVKETPLEILEMVNS